MKFTKMHGAGNDYVYVDCFDGNLPDDSAELSRQMSHRHFGVGADGLILIRRSDHADARMQMFNADGSEAQMCGNGIRCVAKYVYDHGLCPRSNLKIETACGVLSLDLETSGGVVTRVRVDMGEPILQADQIPTTLPGDPVINRDLDVAGLQLAVTCVSMGNPHCIIFVEQATDALVLETGPRVETHEAFPEKVNVEFIEVISPREVRQRTWERGSGETWACGTGASAVCVAGVLAGRTERKILNHLLGGSLELEWDEATNHVYMTGPATEVFTGNWPTV
jgi:diaminopimelate epimerase